MIGKKVRMERIINRDSGKTVIIPMDHGVTMGPIPGLEDMKATVERIVNGGANAIILHKGILEASHRGRGKDIGLIIHLSASTTLGPDPNAKVRVCTLKEAIRLGADAVSIHVNLGAESEGRMLRDLGEVAGQCQEWGMPLVAMMYARGKKVENQFDVKYVKHAARVGAELGADIIKVNYTGSVESFREVVQSCPVPVVIAGGEKMDTDRAILEMIDEALKAGAKGVSIGRNAFEHENPARIVKAISQMVHQGSSVEAALKILEEK